jgi:hypothetical protein
MNKRYIPVWTLDACGKEESIDEGSRFATALYTDEAQAEQDAETWAKEIAQWADPKEGKIVVSILVGEEQKVDTGDVYGESTPIPIWIVENGTATPYTS